MFISCLHRINSILSSVWRRHLSFAYSRIYAINIRHHSPFVTVSFRLHHRLLTSSNGIKSTSSYNNPTYTHHLHLLRNDAHTTNIPSYIHTFVCVEIASFLMWVGGLACVKLKVLITLEKKGELWKSIKMHKKALYVINDLDSTIILPTVETGRGFDDQHYVIIHQRGRK